MANGPRPREKDPTELMKPIQRPCGKGPSALEKMEKHITAASGYVKFTADTSVHDGRERESGITEKFVVKGYVNSKWDKRRSNVSSCKLV